MSLLPWMEKCVLEWNESVRLPCFVCAFSGQALLKCGSDIVFVESEVTFEVVLVYEAVVWDAG